MSYLQTRVRMFPHSSGLRKVFLKFMLDYFVEDQYYQLATANMALIALKLRHTNLQNR